MPCWPLVLARTAIIHPGRGLDTRGTWRKALKEGQGPRRVGFPKCRERGKHMSFTPTRGCNAVRVDGDRVRLPVFGWVRLREPPRFAGDILSAAVGLDMGIKVLATLWDGDERADIANPRPLQEALAELRCIDQAIARGRKVHGTHRTSHHREVLYARWRGPYARVFRRCHDHH